MAGQPDPKGAPRKRGRIRVVDRGATSAFMEGPRPCVVCGNAAESAHHVVRRGAPHFGDDIEANFMAVCGHGTARCHGALHGNPYAGQIDGHACRITSQLAHERVGRAVLRRPDTLMYLGGKFGAEAAREFLERVYHVPPGA